MVRVLQHILVFLVVLLAVIPLTVAAVDSWWYFFTDHTLILNWNAWRVGFVFLWTWSAVVTFLMITTR